MYRQKCRCVKEQSSFQEQGPVKRTLNTCCSQAGAVQSAPQPRSTLHQACPRLVLPTRKPEEMLLESCINTHAEDKCTTWTPLLGDGVLPVFSCQGWEPQCLGLRILSSHSWRTFPKRLVTRAWIWASFPGLLLIPGRLQIGPGKKRKFTKCPSFLGPPVALLLV